MTAELASSVGMHPGPSANLWAAFAFPCAHGAAQAQESGWNWSRKGTHAESDWEYGPEPSRSGTEAGECAQGAARWSCELAAAILERQAAACLDDSSLRVRILHHRRQSGIPESQLSRAPGVQGLAHQRQKSNLKHLKEQLLSLPPSLPTCTQPRLPPTQFALTKSSHPLSKTVLCLQNPLKFLPTPPFPLNNLLVLLLP